MLSLISAFKSKQYKYVYPFEPFSKVSSFHSAFEHNEISPTHSLHPSPKAISIKQLIKIPQFSCFCAHSAETYVRHPNSYLPKYNIQSETDGESIPLTNDMIVNKRMLKNGVDVGPHQIIQSDDDDDVPAYGFPRRNRVQPSDLELELSKGGKLADKNTSSSDMIY
jgi:hypothetical protein